MQYFKKPEEHLVHDPNNSLRMGDVIEVQASWRSSKTKRFVVNRIVAPFGPPIDERPPVPTPEEREATKAAKRAAKVSRRELRRNREEIEVRFERSMDKIRQMVEATGLDASKLDGKIEYEQDS